MEKVLIFILFLFFVIFVICWISYRALKAAYKNKPMPSVEKESKSPANKWESHPEFETIKSRIDLIVRFLSEGDLSKAKNGKEIVEIIKNSETDIFTTLAGIRKCLEAYRQLLEFGIIDDIPFSKNRPKGVSKDVDILLPKYAFMDWSLGKLILDLSNSFAGDENKASIDNELRSELQKTVIALSNFLSKFPNRKKYNFIHQSSEETISKIESDLRLTNIEEAFR